MTRALLQQALDALKDSYFSDEHRNYELQAKAIAALREALNAPELEPVAEVFDTFGNSQDPNKAVGHVWLKAHYFPPKGAKLYAVPPAAPAPDGWVMVPREPTPEMIAAYLAANMQYWAEVDALPSTPITKWRQGTPSDATRESYRAMIAAAPAAPVVREPRHVRKVGGSFQHTGTVVAEFKTTAGEPRIVLEFDAPVAGMLHVYRPDQVEDITGSSYGNL